MKSLHSNDKKVTPPLMQLLFRLIDFKKSFRSNSIQRFFKANQKQINLPITGEFILSSSLILICSLFFQIGFSQSSWLPFASARSEGMGGVSLFFQDANSIFSNQAGLAKVEKFQGQIGAQQRFALADLNTFNGGFAYPTKSGTFGLSFQQFGFEAFKQQKLGIAYARKLFQNLNVGAQFDYLNTQMAEYGNKGFVTFELGFQAFIGEEVIFAAHAFSPIRIEILEGEHIPSLLKAGIAYLPNEKILVGLEAEKDILTPLTMKLGIEYQIVEVLILRVGGASNPTLFSAGLGLRLKNGLQFDLGTSFHQYLGVSPSVGVRFRN